MRDLQYGQSNEVLQFIIQNDIININDVQNSIEAMKREELLKRHPYKIWEGKDGKWYTYLPDEKKGRILKKKTTKKAIEDDVVKYLKEELGNPTIRDVFTDWIDKKAEMGEIGSPTYERYKIDFARYLGNLKRKESNERSRKLFEARISALFSFLFLSLPPYSEEIF